MRQGHNCDSLPASWPPGVLEPHPLLQRPCVYCPLQDPVFLQVLSQLTPQTVMEIDGLLSNKPHPKK